MASLPTDSNTLIEVKANNMSTSVMGQEAKFGKVEKTFHSRVVRRIVDNNKIVVTILGCDFGNKQYLDFLEGQNNPNLPNVVLYTYLGNKTSSSQPTQAIIRSCLPIREGSAEIPGLSGNTALQDIHNAGFVHGSISPETIHVIKGKPPSAYDPGSTDKIVLTRYNCVHISQQCRRDIYIIFCSDL